MPDKKSAVNGNLFSNKILGLVDRDREIKQLMYALFTKEHMLLMGPPGTAKSLFASNAFKAIDGAKLFSIHLTKQTTEEYVFGPLNIIELKKGNVVHNTKDSILESDFAFIDEFFDASDVLLRSLLGVLNERVWMKGQQKINAKLHTAILTSNYQRENDVTEAVLDRVVFKAEIQPITAKSKRMRVYKDYLGDSNFQPPKILDLKKLKEFTEKVDDPKSVKFSDDILKIFDELVDEYAKETKKYISQRTANKALKVLKASALLNGRKEVVYKDMEELKYVLCVLNRRVEEEVFDAVYEKYVGNAEEEQIVMTDLEEIDEKFSKVPTNFDKLGDKDFVEKMAELTELVNLLENMNCPTQRSKQTRDKLMDKMRKVVDENRDKLFKRS
jgi:MoxR-like ATPase